MCRKILKINQHWEGRFTLSVTILVSERSHTTTILELYEFQRRKCSNSANFTYLKLARKCSEVKLVLAHLNVNTASNKCRCTFRRLRKILISQWSLRSNSAKFPFQHDGFNDGFKSSSKNVVILVTVRDDILI